MECKQRRRGVAVGLVGLAAVATLGWLGCGSIPDGWEGVPEPRVLASFPPVACFVENVAGDQGGVRCLCTGTGPHDYKFNINDSVRLKRANIFFANGFGLDDHFTDRMVNNSGNAQLQYRKLAAGLPDALRKKGEAHAHEHGHDHDHDHHHHGPHDPHVWLGIPQAIGMVELVRDDLTKVDPAHAALYKKNADEYVGRLKKLHAEGKEKLKGLKKTPVVTFHESMAYFADSFGLNVIGSIQPSAGVDPDARNIRNILEKCKGSDRVIITVEPQYPKTAAETLEKELKKSGGVREVVLVTVDPLETCDADDLTRDWYERKMRQNLDNLAKHAP
jgi:zinc transport system substrate-binding protein